MEKFLKTNKTAKLIFDYFLIVIGITLLAASISIFFEPNNIVTGGVTGLGIIIENYTKEIFGFGIPISVTNAVINIPLFILCYKYMGKQPFVRTVFATLFTSVALEYTKLIPPYTGDMIIVTVYGGALLGTGIGIAMRALATTGGTDLLAMLIHNLNKRFTVSQILFTTDTIILLLGFFMFGAERALYGVIAIFICSKCIKSILEGMNFSKAALIISNKSKEIADAILNDVDRGVTSLYGKGMYTGEDKDVILCVFAQKEFASIKGIVNNIDNEAFMILVDSKEVLGEGFQSIE